MLHKIATWYANWLTTPIGVSPVPPILYFLIFCPLAILVVFTYCGPEFMALFHGMPLDGNIQGVNKLGRQFTQPIRPFIVYGSWILAAAVPLFLSALAFQIGWLGREVRDGNEGNDG